MASITSFRDLNVWEKAMRLATRVHRATHKLPASAQMALGHQLKKSAVSIPSNIAEGFSRHSTAHYIQHLWTARASTAELATQIELARRLEFLDETTTTILLQDADEVSRMLHALARSLERGTP